MPTRTSILIYLLLVTTAAAADVRHGQELAERWCAACHVIKLGPQAATEAPSFRATAANRKLDAAALARFLMDPHPKMPNMSLTRSEAADLAAYIKSLGGAE